MPEANNKRVAKNTLFLYFRMILIMLVSLYTSRVVLAQLGISDFGIYNVTAGVVTMLSFLNSCMASSTQRYMTFELGRGDMQRLKDVFAASLNIHAAMALVIVVLAETLGLWIVNHQLVIPPDRMLAAHWVYQFAILTFCINIIQVPYNAVLIAHERMNVYAYFSIVEVCLKLGIVYLLVVCPIDKLIAYGVLLFSVQLIVRCMYQLYCHKHYEESRFRWFWDKALYRQMTGFAGWNLFGSIAWLLRDQGVNIILNLFFGPVINAARGVALQVSNAVMGFIANFQVALNPQITKNYAQGHIAEMEKLAYLGIKFSFIILFLLAFPLALNIDYVLHVWLEEVPEHTSLFVTLIMADGLCGTLFGVPLMTSLSATGKIRNYQVWVSLVILFIVPAGYMALSLGCEASSVFYVSMLFTLLSGFVRFLFCRSLLGYSLRRMTGTVLVPVFGMVALSLPLPILLKVYVWSTPDLGSVVLSALAALLVAACAAWLVGMQARERSVIVAMVRSRLPRKQKQTQA